MLRGVPVAWVVGRWALYVPAARVGWLSIELLAGRLPDWGVARKRRERIDPNQECPLGQLSTGKA
jgi:hypothetical protein